MELYYGTELPEHVITCLKTASKEQFGFHADTTETVEGIVNGVNLGCLKGKFYIIYHKEVVLLFSDQAPYVLKMDSIRGINASVFDFIKAVNKAVTLFTEKTLIHKLETRTPFTELSILAKRCKWEHEGTFKQSYQMPDGSFSDEVSFGMILHRSLEQKTHAMNLLNASLGKINNIDIEEV